MKGALACVAALTGVEPGDEVSVVYDDAGGHAVHSIIVLPPAFPALVGTGPAPGLAEGELLLTLSSWNADPERFHAALRVVARPLDAPDIRDRVRLEVRVPSR